MRNLMETCLLLATLVGGISAAKFQVERQLATPKVPVHDGKIVGGEAVPIDLYPYQLSMQVNGRHICGASIISVNWAVTAAHCSASVACNMRVRAGSTDRTTGGTIHKVNEKIIHAQHNSSTYDYDIALLRVSPPFVYTSSILNIQLPDQGSPVATGITSFVSGWGTLDAGSNSIPLKLQAVNVPVVSQESCKTSYPNYITDRMICAGFTSGGHDSCQGDSGGPMVVMAGNVKQLVGIVSWGYSCAVPNYPGVYTRVASLRDWIKSQSGV